MPFWSIYSSGNLYFVLKGGKGELMRLDWFNFSAK